MTGGDTDGRTVTYEIAADERPSRAVVRAVAAREDTSPLDLDPLYGVIDPDHLDSVMEDTGTAPAPTGRSVTFVYADCRITVTTEAVTVRAPDADPGD